MKLNEFLLNFFGFSFDAMPRLGEISVNMFDRKRRPNNDVNFTSPKNISNPGKLMLLLSKINNDISVNDIEISILDTGIVIFYQGANYFHFK